MPWKPNKPCGHPGCGVLTDRRYCRTHEQARQADLDIRRGSAAERGYDSRWAKARRHYLHLHPLCRECGDAGQVTAATVVDHVIPHRGDQALFWDSQNWQPLCAPCHNRKTATKDSSFAARR